MLPGIPFVINAFSAQGMLEIDDLFILYFMTVFVFENTNS